MLTFNSSLVLLAEDPCMSHFAYLSPVSVQSLTAFILLLRFRKLFQVLEVDIQISILSVQLQFNFSS